MPSRKSERLKPDIYAVNEDGDRGGKREYCAKHGHRIPCAQAHPGARAAAADEHGFARVLSAPRKKNHRCTQMDTDRMGMTPDRSRWCLRQTVASSCAARVRQLPWLPLAPAAWAQTNAPGAAARGGTIIDFERALKRMRFEHYRHPRIDILKKGFRPVGGSVADFGTARHNGRDHFFYIERRLQEGTPFYPGHEIYFGHASTPDFFEWEVHDPVLLIRPGTWEEAHVWAPVLLRDGDEFIMAYTGLNRHLSPEHRPGFEQGPVRMEALEEQSHLPGQGRCLGLLAGRRHLQLP